MVGLTRLSLANRAVVMLLSLVIVGLGLFALRTLKQEFYPSLTIPGAAVVAVYPGASSGTVERDITRPLEDAVKTVDGIDKVTSVSATNVSQVSLEWDYELDTNGMEDKVRSAVEGTRAQLPADIDPQVTVGSTDDIPVLIIAVSADTAPDALSEQLNEVALPTLRAIPGVRDATLSGEETHQVITTRSGDLNRLKVDPSQIPQMIQADQTVVPGGTITQQGQDISVQVGSTLGSVDDIRSIRLQGTDGPGGAGRGRRRGRGAGGEPSSISRVNGKPSLTLAVTKTLDANSVTVAHAVQDALPDISRDIGGNTSFALSGIRLPGSSSPSMTSPRRVTWVC